MTALNLLKQTTEYEVLQSFRDKVSKLEQEISYSEEEVLQILAQFENDEPFITKEWFEQFKKK